MSKPFFYKIVAADLLNFATDEEAAGMTLLQFAKELQKETSEIAFIQGIFDETREFIDKKSAAGQKGMAARWKKPN